MDLCTNLTWVSVVQNSVMVSGVGVMVFWGAFVGNAPPNKLLCPPFPLPSPACSAAFWFKTLYSMNLCINQFI